MIPMSTHLHPSITRAAALATSAHAGQVRDDDGGPYIHHPERVAAALAQYAATGCLNGTFYAGADAQLETVLALAQQVEPEFVAKVAIHAREIGHMKDVPALLLAIFAVRDVQVVKRVFARVCTNGKMVRTLLIR